MQNHHRAGQGPKAALALMALAAASLAAQPAAAHPHVWIDARSSVVFDAEGRISAINVAWEFDETYSVFAVEGLDKDGDGKYSAEELKPVADDNIAALKDYRYFTYASVDGKAVEYGPVSDYGAGHEAGKLTLAFTIPLKTPADPVAGKFAYRMYDPTIYIDISLSARNALSIAGKAPKYCTIFAGKAEAEQEETQVAESFFARLTSDDDFGARFARPIGVDCRPGKGS